ncbi:MAG TPA: Uma2 family endonuclease [Pyrinomonadaceae bacterium]|nr:Uma2 family endonuclease [Pyrinomonadaceae bacterium]
MFILKKPIVRLTPEEYLAAERKAENKSELIDGEVVAMSGASRRHNLIAVNLTREISLQLKGRPCEAYASGMRVRAASANLYTYPDVSAVCGEPQFEDEHADTLLNPTLIVEVLSESTETFDRGKKFDSYRTIESLAEYLLVSQGAYRIEQHTKQADGRWLLSEYRSLHDAVVLSSIQCKLALREVYDKIKLS